jgi:ubiquinone/menaquinone biosynthesis C-methylase UbiE
MARSGARHARARRLWSTAEGRADWLDPDPDVRALLPELKARGARTALDLGCGVGRHSLFLVEHGLAVEAIDGSAAGLAVMRETARARGVSLGLRQGTADALPFDDGSFDFVLSWNVIYHGTLGDVGRRLAEIWRVVKLGVLYQGTMLPMRKINYGNGRTVAPDTFVVDGAEERGHPHFYCNAATPLRCSPTSSCSPSNSSTASPVPGTGTSLPSAGRRRQSYENWPVLPDSSAQTLDSSQ